MSQPVIEIEDLHTKKRWKVVSCLPIEDSTGNLENYTLTLSSPNEEKEIIISKFSGMQIPTIKFLYLYRDFFLLRESVWKDYRKEIEDLFKNDTNEPSKSIENYLSSGSYGSVSLILPEYIICKKFISNSSLPITEDQVREIYMQSLFGFCSCTPRILLYEIGESPALYSTYEGKTLISLKMKDISFSSLKVLFECLNVYALAGITHGDLKPENILVTHSGEFKIIDWGFGTQNSSNTKFLLRQTRLFRAPELIGKNIDAYDIIDEKSDIFSIALVLLDILLGEEFRKERIDCVLKDTKNEEKKREEYNSQLKTQYRENKISKKELTSKSLSLYVPNESTLKLYESIPERLEPYLKSKDKTMKQFCELLINISKIDVKKRWSYKDILNSNLFRSKKTNVNVYSECKINRLFVFDLSPSIETVKSGYGIILKIIKQLEDEDYLTPKYVDVKEFICRCFDTFTYASIVLKDDIESEKDIKDLCKASVFIVCSITGITPLNNMNDNVAFFTSSIMQLKSNMLLNGFPEYLKSKKIIKNKELFDIQNSILERK